MEKDKAKTSTDRGKMVVALFLPSPSASESVADKEANLAEKKQLKSESSSSHTQENDKWLQKQIGRRWEPEAQRTNRRSETLKQ